MYLKFADENTLLRDLLVKYKETNWSKNLTIMYDTYKHQYITNILLHLFWSKISAKRNHLIKGVVKRFPTIFPCFLLCWEATRRILAYSNDISFPCGRSSECCLHEERSSSPQIIYSNRGGRSWTWVDFAGWIWRRGRSLLPQYPPPQCCPGRRSVH